MEIPRWAARVTAAVVVGGALIIRRALQDAASRSDTEGSGPRKQTFWHWRCECGAHSRGGDPFKSDAEYNAQRHQWRKEKGHPMPEVYSTEEEVEW
ncbi:hypothetical protein [Streptomyces sp. NPDC091027]|uniref:hypothetical protein n=1 Tax=Streptomyces sp. NPDC091027 TaxID=3365971 RepID=UPI00382C8EAB